ncbi:MAG: hypothetical protein WCY11_17995 [Novosphingobium sp.]
MSRTLALAAHALPAIDATEWTRRLLVGGCALALICADRFLPVIAF